MAEISSPNDNEEGCQDSVPLLSSNEEERFSRTALDLLRRLISSMYSRRGLLWVLMSIVSQSIQVIMLTTVSKEMSAEQASFVRSSFLLIAIIGVSWQRSDSNNILDMGIFILDAICDFVFIYFIAMAGQYIWAGDVSAVSLNLPIPSSIFACILFGEPFDRLDAAFVLVNAIGLVIVSKPSWLFPSPSYTTSSSHNTLLGVFLAFCSLAGNVGATMSARGLAYRNSEDAWLLAFMNGMVGMVASSCLAFFTSSWVLPHTWDEWQGVLVLGICTPFICLPYAKSLETEDVKTVSVAMTLSIPLTSCYDFFLLNRSLDLAQVCAELLIVGSTFAMYLKSLRISWQNNGTI